MRLAFVLAFLAGGCASEVTEALPLGTWDLFVSQAEPVLAERCANPSCHGNDARPLSLFATHRHRLAPEERFLDTPLSEEELTRNYWRAAAFVVGLTDPGECQLLTRPSTEHAGVRVFADESDYDYERLSEWVEASALAAGSAP